MSQKFQFQIPFLTTEEFGTLLSAVKIMKELFDENMILCENKTLSSEEIKNIFNSLLHKLSQDKITIVPTEVAEEFEMIKVIQGAIKIVKEKKEGNKR